LGSGDTEGGRAPVNATEREADRGRVP
jgi:hypothetical protein